MLTLLIANTTRWTDVGLLMDHRLRRWSIIKPILEQRVVFAVSYHPFTMAIYSEFFHPEM